MFGYGRTTCACNECSQHCWELPGYLVPQDLELIRQREGENFMAWCEANLLASPGAIVMRLGKILRIPTLVPARRADGACKFLDEDGRCQIHDSSPYGCSHFDSHMPQAEATDRSQAGLFEIYQAWQHIHSYYRRVWIHLATKRKCALPPEHQRRFALEVLRAT